MCLYPTLIINPKYKPNKKNGYNPPTPKDERTKYVPIGCQDCMECRKQKQRDWQVRLLEDIKTHTNGKFITLTFSNESITELIQNPQNLKATAHLKELTGYQLDNAIATTATRLFLERWRKKFKKSLRHWLVTELGHDGTENIHLHGIVWTNESFQTIRNHWQYGHIWPSENIQDNNYVNEATVNYSTKYVSKVDKLHSLYKSIILTSPGIGHNYTNTFNATRNNYQEDKTRETYKTRTGHNITLPIYWRNKIYNEHQREKLWLFKLDKQIRWVCGEKIPVDKTLDHYNKTLKWHQERNKRLGYGDGTKTWEEEKYQNALRQLRYEQRTKKTAAKEEHFF